MHISSVQKGLSYYPACNPIRETADWIHSAAQPRPSARVIKNEESWQQMVWPPQSSDLNTMEPRLDYMKGQKTMTKPASTKQLFSKTFATNYLPSTLKNETEYGLEG